MENDMDSSFDNLAVIKSLTLNNLNDISFMEMLNILTPLVLTEVPENDSTDNRKRLDFLLARLANLNAYLRVLWAHASHQRAVLKKMSPDKAEEMMKKKEALYEIANAVKLKYEAVSRKITLALETEEEVPERASYDHRREARDTRREPEKAKPSNGGWGSVR